MDKLCEDDLYEENIFEYLESINDEDTVNLNYYDELIYKIHSYTLLSIDEIKLVLSAIFQEIRAALLRGECVGFQGFGLFYLRQDKLSSYVKFKLSRKIMKIFNYDK